MSSVKEVVSTASSDEDIITGVYSDMEVYVLFKLTNLREAKPGTRALQKGWSVIEKDEEKRREVSVRGNNLDDADLVEMSVLE